MTELVFATNNLHKLREISQIVDENFKILSLSDINFSEEIPEEQDTLQGNALQKAHHIHSRYKVNCFADDTGLEIDALNGAPGVYSARFAGEKASFEDNVKLALKKLEGKTNRKARFRTVIALILDDKEYLFEGKIEGEILEKTTGNSGFGYDPIFKPAGYNQSFAEMPAELKNKISHRGLASQKLVDFLNTHVK